MAQRSSVLEAEGQDQQQGSDGSEAQRSGHGDVCSAHSGLPAASSVDLGGRGGRSADDAAHDQVPESSGRGDQQHHADDTADVMAVSAGPP